ncbi:MAG: DUF433 domain-containing protein [Proteobacteria bacterium]|nr:DUF433 domain-containing protein [Pseudomonadota bacterium]
MTATAEIASHIQLDDSGVAWVDDTNTKVVEIVQDSLGHGWSPEEIHNHLAHLPLAQIHAALACHFGHQAQLDAELAKRKAYAADWKRQLGDSPAVRRLRSAGRLK